MSASQTAQFAGRFPTVMVLYWGRRGLSNFASSVAAGAKEALPQARVILSISHYNKDSFHALSDVELHKVDLFKNSIGVIAGIWKLPILVRRLCDYVKKNEVDIIIDIMPHIWARPIYRELRSMGIRIVSIAHDDIRHPGDPLSIIRQFADHALHMADLVVTLSHSVAAHLQQVSPSLVTRLLPLYHPVTHVEAARQRKETISKPRILFLGRILPYKGLDLFLDAAEILRNRDRPIEIGVFGEGSLQSSLSQIRRLNVECVNRWLSDSEISDILSRYDVLVASHRQASQSGVVAAAQGAGLPCVVTPVGGLVEQIKDGETGLVAKEVSASALADSIESLCFGAASEIVLHSRIAARAQFQSGKYFAEAIFKNLASSGLSPPRQSKEFIV